MEQSRLSVLKRVELGEISLEEAADRLTEIEQNRFDAQPQSEEIFNDTIFDHQSTQAEKREKPAWSIIFWLVPLIIGVLLTVFSSTWLYQSFYSSGLGFKFWLTWIPFIIGVFMMYMGWELQRARWIHIHIKQPKGESPHRIFFAFPLPFKFMGFALKSFKRKIPASVSDINIEDLMQVLDQQFNKDEPLFLDVNDEDGTKVEIYIG